MANKGSYAARSRRDFLKTAAHAGLSTGLLKASALTTGMMLSRTAVSQSDTGIKRVVCLYTPNGSVFKNGKSLFIPEVDASTSELILNKTSAPLESLKSECVFFSDAKVPGVGGGHGNTTKVLGFSKNHKTTFDVMLANTLGASAPFPHLLLGVESMIGNRGTASALDGRQVPYEDNPFKVFDRVFNSNVSTAEVGVRREQRVLDAHMAEIAELKKILGSSETRRLEEHLSSLEAIERRLQSKAGNTCRTSAWNSGGFAFSSTDPMGKKSFTTVSELQMDLAVLALRCNYTRVVSIMLADHMAQHLVPELPLSVEDNYHTAVHYLTKDREDSTKGNHYLVGRLAYLLEKLKNETDEFGNSLLDSTLVINVTDMADGHLHSTNKAPVVLAGGGSNVKGGQLTTCGNFGSIFDTVTAALGLKDEIPWYGEAGGPLSGIFV